MLVSSDSLSHTPPFQGILILIFSISTVVGDREASLILLLPSYIMQTGYLCASQVPVGPQYVFE